MKHLKLLAGVLLALLLISAQQASRAADPIKIRIGWIAAPANLAPILFAKDGIARIPREPPAAHFMRNIANAALESAH